MTMTVPAELREDVLRRAQSLGQPNVEDYLTDLIVQDLSHEAKGWELPARDDATYRNREELEARLLEGLDSGDSIPATPEFYAAIHARVAARLAAR